MDAVQNGFYGDEVAGTVYMLCMAQEGIDGNGNAWPLFSRALGGGYTTPLFLYSGALWSIVLGTDHGALRFLCAIAGTVAVVGMYALGRRASGGNVTISLLLH